MKSGSKSVVAFVAALAVICGGFVLYTNGHNDAAENVYAEETENAVSDGTVGKTLTLVVDDPIMQVNGVSAEIDPEGGTAPVIVSGRTLVPIRAIIENMGGSVEWNAEKRESVLTYGEDVIRLTIDSETAYLNENASVLDTAPTIINGRTMLPIRFIAEGFGFDVDWDEAEKTITISEKAVAESDTTSESGSVTETDENAPVVYMTEDITPEALVEIYEKLDFNAEGNVAVKMSTGEPPASNYLRPELIKDLVQKVNGTIVECNTAYGGSRSETAAHKQVAEDHGFTAIANVDIMDEDGSTAIPVPTPESGASTITEDYVGTHLENYDSLISLAHFKGHAMAGFGGAIKNMSIGAASSKGKAWIHSGGTSTENAWGGEQDKFLEAMGDATSAVVDYMDSKVVYINVMNRLSVDCDCDGNPAEPDMHDIGILASTDPVALDQACIDLIYEQKDGDGASLVERIESRNGLHTLEHAEEIGLGSREYKLVSID